jgi:hypothetical protein
LGNFSEIQTDIDRYRKKLVFTFNPQVNIGETVPIEKKTSQMAGTLKKGDGDANLKTK